MERKKRKGLYITADAAKRIEEWADEHGQPKSVAVERAFDHATGHADYAEFRPLEREPANAG